MKIEKRDQKRSGLTEVTSVSISKEFARVMRINELSPTEVFRRGLAVTLCDLGDSKYMTQMNKQRLEKSNELLKSMKELEQVKIKLIQVRELLEELDKGWQ